MLRIQDQSEGALILCMFGGLSLSASVGTEVALEVSYIILLGVSTKVKYF